MFITTGKKIINLDYVKQIGIEEGLNFWNIVFIFSKDEYSVGFPSREARDKMFNKITKIVEAFDLRK